MRFKIFGMIAINFLTDDERYDRGIKTLRHTAVGEITAEDQVEAENKAKSQISTFIDTNYPVRWSFDIEALNVVQVEK